MVFGAVQMMELRSHAWAIGAAILAILACSLIGFPVGIWALVVLLRADVRETFASRPATPFPPMLKWPRVLAASVVAVILAALGLSSFHRLLERSHHEASEDETEAYSQPIKDDHGSTNSTTPMTDVINDASYSRSLPVGPGGKLTMHVDRGDIDVTGSNQNTVEIKVDREVTHAGDFEAARILKEERLVLKQTGNEVFITAQDPPSLERRSLWSWLSGPNLNVHYQITVPRKFEVRAETSGGHVNVASLDGSATVKTAGGSLDFNDIDGSVRGETMGGSIRAVACQDELIINTLGGGITIEQFTGSHVRAATAGGSISVEFATAPTADCELQTEGGSVTARLPSSAAITLDAHTLGGSVSTDLPIQVEGESHNSDLKGTINGGGPLLKLETSGGSIKVLKQ
jgi:hypothetical protein